MRIGLDIDGVLADFGTHFLNYIKAEDKTPPTKWDDDRFMSNFHKVKNNNEFWLTVPRLINPEDLKFKPVMYVTARAIPTEITKQWLDENGFPDVPVISVGINGSKVEHLKGKVDVFVDDAFHNYEELNNAGVNCLLMTRSHNVKEFVGFDRIENLNEVVNHVYTT